MIKYYSDDQIKEEMGGECSMWRGEVRTGFWWGKERGTDHLEDLAVKGRYGSSTNMGVECTELV